MTDHYPDPSPHSAGTVFLYKHPHEWQQIEARLNPNGTWSSVWFCTVCEDVSTGDLVGPIPTGRCDRCRWIQKQPDRKKCEDCGHKLPPYERAEPVVIPDRLAALFPAPMFRTEWRSA